MAPKSRKRSAQDAPSVSYVLDVPDETAEPPYDAIRFRSLTHQKHFFEWVQNRTPNVEVPFQLHSTEFPHITAEIQRRGWHYLCNPIQGKLGITLLREFYANAKKSKRERALYPPVYISRIRGKDLDYSLESLKVVLQLPDVDVEGPTYEARRNSNDLRLGKVLRDIVNPYLKGRLPEDIPEWMQANLQAGRGRFHDGISRTPRDCWPGATSRGPASTSNEEDKGKGKAEEGDNDERGKKKAWEARDNDLNQLK
ncbi:hypothetical protein PIB30_105258, partial [Stylosanthes scabra]|nr:hypothetical protein [Stylosanthes scabra]